MDDWTISPTFPFMSTWFMDDAPYWSFTYDIVWTISTSFLNKNSKDFIELKFLLSCVNYVIAVKFLHSISLSGRKCGIFYIVNSLYFSGVTDTDAHHHMYKTWYGCIIWPFHKFFVKTPYYGAQTTLYCCLSDSIIHGGYYRYNFT